MHCVMLYVGEIAARLGKTGASRERRCFAKISNKELGKISPVVCKQEGMTNIRISCKNPGAAVVIPLSLL